VHERCLRRCRAGCAERHTLDTIDCRAGKLTAYSRADHYSCLLGHDKRPA